MRDDETAMRLRDYLLGHAEDSPGFDCNDLMGALEDFSLARMVETMEAS